MNGLPDHVSHLTALDIQREKAELEHNQDVTHIIAAAGEFENLFPHRETDTIIWLQLPAESAGSVKMSCTGVVYPNSWVLHYSSTVLRSSGFEKFTQLLENERYQKRKASELLNSGLLGLNGPTIMRKIRYVLDLGPSTDFELRSEHLEALTLPKGIIQYSMLTRLSPAQRVPTSAAGGHDDACRCFSLKLRGDLCNDPGCWFNGEHRPFNGSLCNSTANRRTSGSAAATETQAEVDRTTESAQFRAIFDPDSGDTNTTAPADPATGTDAEAISTSPQAPEVIHAPADTHNLGDGSLSGSIWDLPLSPEFRIDDYCEIRHIANIIRLLLAMAGKPLLLNSAARVYTIAGLAKLFRLKSSDIYHINAGQVETHSNAFGNRLRSIFSDWFFARNNTNIVDILPEESLIIAWNIKLPVIVRVAFRILVAERALHEAGTTDAQPRKYQSRQKTVFGRELQGLLDEDVETMLDHASESFVQRVLRARDAHSLHINSITKLVTVGPSTSDLEDAQSYPTLRLFARPVSNYATVHQLLETLRILEDLVEVEQSLARGSNVLGNIFLPLDQCPVANALAALQLLLDKIENAISSGFPRDLPNSDLLLSTYTDTVQESLAYYVRQSTLHKNWFVHIYNDLAFDKKCMTAVYWRLLGRSMEDRLAHELSQFKLINCVSTVNTTLYEAIAFDVPLGTEESRHNFREDFIDRLNAIGMNLESSTILSHTKYDFFSAGNLHYSLYNQAEQIYKPFFDRHLYAPEFELEVKASPHLLLGLSSDEFRFLPLWAGGDNDGTGAVFEPALPTATLGPIAPGPEYHTGTTNTSLSTPSIDGALSMDGPPSISDSGDTERFTDIAMSDAGTEHLHDDDGASVSSSFVLVRNLDGLNIATSERSASTRNSLPSNVSRAVNDGHSTITGASGASIAAPSSSSSASSTSGAMTSVSFDDMVVVQPAGTASGSQRYTGSPPLVAVAQDNNDVEFEFEDDDFNYGDDDDVEDQEYYDDDDDADARSDDTVMPDREEVEQEMRRDVEMRQQTQAGKPKKE
ncbi:hypothetical protein SEUCBS139899_001187 [Sporothrix eucalyptigena]|uniref:Uncharacterized protein n=1 Tax=Sporothrix eucalyptigena TaxID=1812306 RepID=A0ABP0BS60_9PEZI